MWNHDRFSRNYYIAVCSLLLCGSLYSVADARIFGRRRGGGGDGNVRNDAPVAPADLQPEPQNYGMQPMQCGPEGCAVQSPVPQVPQSYSVPTQTVVQAPGVTVVRRVLASVPDLAPAPVADNRTVDDRVNRLVDALESRLGIAPAPSVAGNPSAVLNGLPVIELVRRNQAGEVEDSVELNTLLWVKRQLGLTE